ncbi:flagellar biosynthesis regulator FlaF [Meridianimarinicoccus sp. RP-17]|uniref:flagellar biosynthesis regulator FlaF n=1 Tax=Meridianimarinicoccus zhengii TaxID=2056810 RepID=UPI002E26ED9B|nr:flagellar biosynthesis regulator FlaF [Phycocomes zhengii]
MAQARKAYEIGNPALRSPRSTEYEAFARVTRALKSAASRDAPGKSETIRALHENRRLWTLLAASVADDDNGLPDDLRARLFYLYEFTTVHTRRVLRGEAGIDPLVDVNAAVMAGLRGPGGGT